MSARSERIERISRAVRSSQAYAHWVRMNKGPACIVCGSTENLECHHVVKLSSIIADYINLFGSDEDVLRELKNDHANDQVRGHALCKDCHKGKHKLRTPLTDRETGTIAGPWCILPHPLGIPLSPSRSNYPPGSIGLIAFQTLLGIGYHLLNGNFDSKMHEINYRRFAELIGKKPCTSFARLLDSALRDLTLAGVVAGHARKGSTFEIHLDKKYIASLKDHYWFFPLDDVPSPSVVSLALKVILSQNKRNYRISLEKLCKRVGLSFNHPPMARKYVREAVKRIPWASVKIEKDICTFSKRKHGYPPVHTLRQMRDDSIRQNS